MEKIGSNPDRKMNLPSYIKSDAAVALTLLSVILLSFVLTSFKIMNPIALSGDNYTIPSRTGVYVPLFMYPTSADWTTVINAKLAHPSVPIVAAIDPSNGAGISTDSNYTNEINNLKAAGVMVLGYVYTSYGLRNMSSVETEMQTYKNWYNIDGIMLDEMSNSANDTAYYKSLESYALSLGLNFVMGNPGASVPSSFVGSVDNIAIYESSGTPSLSTLQNNTFYPTYDKGNFTFFSHGVSSLDAAFVRAASKYVGLMYITNGNPPTPYDTLSPYFGQLVSTLDNSIAAIYVAPNVLTLSNTGTAGGYATLNVAGFAANEKVQTYLDYTPTSVITVGSTGNGSTLQHYGYVGVDGNTAGTHRIAATGLTSGKTAIGTIMLK